MTRRRRNPRRRRQFRAPDPLRQSQVARFDACAYSLKLEQMEPKPRQVGNMAARGSLFHRWVERALNIMRTPTHPGEQESRFHVEQGMELLLEVLAQRDVPDDEVVHLPMEELRWLRVLVTRWCEGLGTTFDGRSIIEVEKRLFMTVKVPDGRGGFYPRTLTGKPDVIVADPPDGIIIPDWKSGWAPPARLQDDDRDARQVDSATRTEKLSEQGYAQQIMYGALGLHEYPAIERVTLREAYIMAGEYREATVHRYELERIMDILGGVISQIDAAFEAGPDSKRWIPTAGTHCGICPSPRRCPIKDWEGIPTSTDEATLLAREWLVAAQVRKDRLPLLKGYVDAHGPIEIDHAKGRRAVGWVANSTGDGRRFVLHEPEDAPESPWDTRMREAMNAR